MRSLLGISPSVSRYLYERRPNPDLTPTAEVPIAAVTEATPDAQEATFQLLQSNGLMEFNEEENGDFSSIDEDLMTVSSPKVQVVVEGYRSAALIDSGAECNLMSVEQAERFGLPMHKGISIALTGATGRGVFAGACIGVEVSISGISTSTNFLLTNEPMDYIILGRPYERRARLQSRNCDNGQWEGTISSKDGMHQVTFVGVRAQSAGNRTLEQLTRPRKSLKD